MRTIAENRSFLENYVKSLRPLKELERIGKNSLCKA